MATKIWTGTSADWSTSGNWSPSGVPTSGDDVYLENSSQSITAGLGQASVVLNSLNIAQSFTGSLGGTASGPLSIKTAILKIGYHNGPGSPAGSPSIYINLNDTTCATVVDNSGTSADTSRAPIRLYGSAADNDLTVNKGKVEFGTNTDDTSSKLRTVVVKYDNKVATDADLYIGSGVTFDADGTLTCFGGDTIIKCDCPTTTVHGGTMNFIGPWAGTTAFTSYGGTSYLSAGTSTLTNCNIYGGTVDFTKTTSDRTVSNCILGNGGVIKFNSSHVTLSLGVKSADIGEDQTFTGS